MKQKLLFVVIIGMISASCSLFRSNKKGCPSNGANVGAEKIISGDPAAMKAIKKGKKFKGNKF
jgi:hypothetical protein